MTPINFAHLLKSQEFFSKKGFLNVDVPWFVPKAIADITRPIEAGEFKIEKNQEVLIASGEQGLLFLSERGQIGPGLYQTTTPCFRDEAESNKNRIFFYKNELMIAHPEKLDPALNLEFLIDQAYLFFQKILKTKRDLEVVQTKEGFDIEFKGLELGSYGKRQCEFMSWIYGTGCAEPRLSLGLEMRK